MSYIHTLKSNDLPPSSEYWANIVLDDIDIKIDCAVRKCLRKCCPKHQYFLEVNETYICENYENKKFDFSTIPIYDDDSKDKKLDEKFRDTFFLIPGPYDEVISKDEQGFLFIEKQYDMFDSYTNTSMGVITKSGSFYIEFKNAFYRWTLVERFCIDYLVDDETLPRIMAVGGEGLAQPANVFFTTALLISSVFLFLVLLVYCLLPELRNLVGLILMAYDFSVLGAFLFLFTLQVGNFEVIECIALTAITYFFFLSTFCWMNVMSYDIWWTFRGYAKARPIHRRGEKFKFLMYCVYAWGVPLLMAVMLVVLNSLTEDLKDHPWIVTPLIPQAGCFLEGGQKLVYLYIPMLLLILCNWFFFLMTAFNIWRLSRATAVVNSDAAGNPAAHRSQKSRLMIYLKLSLIMGVNWVLEVASFFKPDLYVWKFTDMYNLLMGFAIFMIFVCKRKIYKQLRNRYVTKPLRKTNTSSSTIESNLSQETPLQISTHPMGLKTKSTY